MITAVDLLRGLAALIGWDRIEAPGATGYLDTDYASKGRYAVAAVPTTDIVCVHIEAPDEASHEGNVAAKIQALEEIDRHIVAPLWRRLRAQGDYRILVSPDHPTPVRTKTHSHGYVPFAIAGTGFAADRATTYDEPAAAAADRVSGRLETDGLLPELVANTYHSLRFCTELTALCLSSCRNSAVPASRIREDPGGRPQGDSRPATRQPGGHGRRAMGDTTDELIDLADRSPNGRPRGKWTCCCRPASRSAWR